MPLLYILNTNFESIHFCTCVLFYSYSSYLPLQSLWTKYIEEIITFPKKGNEQYVQIFVTY